MRKGRRTAEKAIRCDLLLSLPEEILFDILTRLPIKSLLRCKSLSKDWLQLISNPGFVQLHMEHAKQNKQKILFASSKSGISNIHSLESETLHSPLVSYNFRLPGALFMVGTCNGLVCLSDYKTIVVLCNPATREHFSILFDKFDVSPDNFEEEFCLGFGHDPVSDEYKILRIDFSYHKSADDDLYTENTNVYVYTLGSKSWRKTESPFRFDKGIASLPYVSGALHVFERNSDCRLNSKQYVSSIIMFDLESEKFKSTPLPHTKGEGLIPGVFQGCFSVSAFRLEGRNVDIWLMKKHGMMESWTKVFSISLTGIQFPVPFGVRKDKVVLLKPWGSKSSWKTEIYAYDPTSTKEEVYSPAISDWTNADAYFESLLPVAPPANRRKETRGRKVRACTYFS